MSFVSARSRQLGLVALIAARDPYADVLRVVKHVIGWRRRVLIENKLSLEDAAFGRVRADELRVRAAS
jgi:predicted transcriptional regulator